ncbi:MAG: hypothetical protein JSS02_11175 [Planctomycetes bacterium]|nr:hypothetical protein [Planctomycetota bacterium]
MDINPRTESGSAVPQPPSPAPAARRRIWKTLTLTGLGLLVLGVVFLPKVIGWSPLRHDLPRDRLKGFEGVIRVESAQLSWFGPNVLEGIQFDGPDGKPFYRVRRVTENRGLWHGIFERTAPVTSVMEEPIVELTIRDDGSNVEDALRPVLATEQEVREQTIKINGGELRLTDAATGTRHVLRILSGEIVNNALDGSPNRVAFETEEADSATAGQLGLKVVFPSVRTKKSAAPPTPVRDIELRLENVSLARTQPLLKRFWPDVEIAGSLSGRLNLKVTGQLNGHPDSSAAGDWTFSSHDVQISSAHLLGVDRYAPGHSEFRGQVEILGPNCRIRDLHLQNDLTRVDGGIAFYWPPALTATAATTAGAREALPEINLHGELDLIALARMLPHALGLREGTELKEGRVEFDLATHTQAGIPRWDGQLRTSRIAGRLAGTELAWDQPLSVGFGVIHNQGRYEIDRIESQSDVFMIHGSATENGLHLETGCDLKEALTRMGQFLNTDNLEVNGALTATADFSRQGDGRLQIDSRISLDDLIVRKLVTRMVERRAGDLEPNPPPEARPQPPAPLPTAPARNRKELAAQKRAERQARVQQRRQDREIRRQANQIVEIPVQEWKTIWTDPKFQISGRQRVDFENRELEIVRFDVETAGLHAHGAGRVAEIPQRCTVTLDGHLDYDAAQLLERARELFGPHVQITGQGTRPFSLKGPLRIPSGTLPRPVVPLELTASAFSNWTSANLFGLEVGAGELDLSLERGVLALRPLEISLGGGKLYFGPRLLLNESPGVLALPGGPVLENVQLTEDFCNDWLKFIAPVLSDATRCSGQFSLGIDEAQLPLGELTTGPLTGRLRIERGQVLPGPLFQQINSLISQMIGGAGDGAAADLLGNEVPLIEMPVQTIAFELHEGRIYHETMESRARGFIIRTRGSVGADQTLDVVAAISFSDEILSRIRLLGPLQGQTLEIPIAGTLRRPRLDARAMGRLAEQLGQSALDKLLNLGLRGFFDPTE